MQVLGADWADIWIMDSGCSRHMTGDKTLLKEFAYEDDGSKVYFGDNSYGLIKGQGKLTRGNISISDVKYVDGLQHNLLSTSQFCDKEIYCGIYIQCMSHQESKIIGDSTEWKKTRQYLHCGLEISFRGSCLMLYC